jgi:branched-chain amino acid transport system permease protein
MVGRVVILVIASLLILTSIQDFPIKNWPTQLTPDKYQRFVFGILLVLMMIFRPEGLLPEPRRAMELGHGEAELPKLKEIENAS